MAAEPEQHDRYAHLRARAAAAKQATCQRLEAACSALRAQGERITADSIKAACGLDYTVYSKKRNPDAYKIYCAYASAFTPAPGKATAKPTSLWRRRRRTVTRDPLLDLPDKDLVARVRQLEAERRVMRAEKAQALQERDEARRQHRVALQAYMMCFTWLCTVAGELDRLNALRRDAGLEWSKQENTS